MVAQAGLELIGSLLDHFVDEIRPAPVRRLKFSLHDFRGGLKKGQEIFARNFRARPNQECKFAVMVTQKKPKKSLKVSSHAFPHCRLQVGCRAPDCVRDVQRR